MNVSSYESLLSNEYMWKESQLCNNKQANKVRKVITAAYYLSSQFQLRSG